MFDVHRVIDAWYCTKRGDFILTLSEPVPRGFYKKCLIDGEEYLLIPVHFFDGALETLLKNIGIKSPARGNFIGKEVEFIKEEQ